MEVLTTPDSKITDQNSRLEMVDIASFLLQFMILVIKYLNMRTEIIKRYDKDVIVIKENKTRRQEGPTNPDSLFIIKRNEKNI
jgi:hypothetical protein